MLKNMIVGTVALLILAGMVMPAHQAVAQGVRGIMPYDREIQIEAVDPMTRMARNAFCTGFNTIDVKLTNSSQQRKYVTIINYDTEQKEQPLYYGWLEPGEQYLSEVMRLRFNLTGPAGIETLRVVVNEYGQMIPGSAASYYVQDCAGFPGGGGSGYYAQVWASVSPSAIEQEKKGTVLLQTNVKSSSYATYYFEILNSYDQLWKRIPVGSRPYERSQVTLPVGKKTKPGVLTYTVKLWYEPGTKGARRVLATTRFSFRVMNAGSGYYPASPYNQGYPGTGWPAYSGTPYSNMPYYGTDPFYGTGYPMAMPNERNIQ
jgi:hypothetical protein